MVDFFQGDFTDAVAQLTDAVQNGWTADLQIPPEWTLPNDPRAAGFAHLVPSLVVVGDRAAAEQTAVDGLERAKSLPYPIGPFSAQYVDCLLAVARSIDGDVVGAAEVGQRLVTVGERHGFAIWSLTGQMQCLYSAIQLGDASCLPGLVQAVEVWHQVVAIDSWTPYWFAGVGFAHLLTGDAESAVGYFDRALAIAATTGARLLHRRDVARPGGGPPSAGRPGGRRGRPGRGPCGRRTPGSRAVRRSGPGGPGRTGMTAGPTTDRAPRRIAIIGGGMAGLAAAWRLSAELGAEAEITVYEQGWQLGGKGASGRGVHGRIEEHGLHVWLGYYDNAFRLIRQVYDDLDRDRTAPDCPIRSWRDAFTPAGRVGVEERTGRGWQHWVATFSTTDGEPGDGDTPGGTAFGGRVPPAGCAAAGRLLRVTAGDAGE